MAWVNCLSGVQIVLEKLKTDEPLIEWLFIWADLECANKCGYTYTLKTVSRTINNSAFIKL